MRLRRATVRAVRTTSGSGFLPRVGDTLELRPRAGALGTYGYEVVGVDGRPVAGLLLGLPANGDAHATRTAEWHARLQAMPRPLPPGLAGVAVWHGTLDGDDGRMAVPAVLAGDPYAEGFVTLHGALTSGLLEAGGARARVGLARALTRAVQDLDDVGAVHGSLDAATVWVRPADHGVRITELESATLRPGSGFVPLAAGAAAGYLAPEMYDGIGEHPEAATAAADRWALAVAVHEILTGHHPYHYLPDLSPGAIGAALAAAWPGHPMSRAAAFALRYGTVLGALPAELRAAFTTTFQQGWADPAARPAAAVWRAILDRSAADPVIDDVRADRDHVLLGEPVTVTWRVRGADRVFVDGVQADPAAGSLQVTLERTRAVELRAVGLFGMVKASTVRVAVLRVPRLRPAEVRFPYALRRAAGPDSAGVVAVPAPPPVRPAVVDPPPLPPVFDPSLDIADAPRHERLSPPRMRRAPGAVFPDAASRTVRESRHHR